MPAPTITAITPESGDTGLALETVVDITFSAEMDQKSITSFGHVIVTGSSSKVVIAGPDSMNFSGDIGQDFLAAKKMSGPISGEITTSDGLTFKFTPDAPLLPNTDYKLIVSTGAVTRTVADLAGDPGNTSTGVVRVSGPYTGAGPEVLTITITTEGALGVAEFTATLGDETVISTGITDRLIDGELGIRIEFDAGNFVEDDSYTAALTEGEALAGIYSSSFSTGDASYLSVPPNEGSFELQEQVIEGEHRVASIIEGAAAPLMVTSIEPEDRSFNIGLGKRSIVVTFNKAIDPASINDATIQLLMENLPTDEEEQVSIPLDVTPTVDGQKLTLTFN